MLKSVAPHVTKSFAAARRALWVWFHEVTIFRVLSRHKCALHGLQLACDSDREKMSCTSIGQEHAAFCLANHFDTSTRGDGKGLSGWARYAKYTASNAGTNKKTLDMKGSVCLPLRVRASAAACMVPPHKAARHQTFNLRLLVYVARGRVDQDSSAAVAVQHQRGPSILGDGR